MSSDCSMARESEGGGCTLKRECPKWCSSSASHRPFQPIRGACAGMQHSPLRYVILLNRCYSFTCTPPTHTPIRASVSRDWCERMCLFQAGRVRPNHRLIRHWESVCVCVGVHVTAASLQYLIPLWGSHRQPPLVTLTVNVQLIYTDTHSGVWPACGHSQY